MLEEHNSRRAAHCAPALEWDAALAESAMARAAQPEPQTQTQTQTRTRTRTRTRTLTRWAFLASTLAVLAARGKDEHAVPQGGVRQMRTTYLETRRVLRLPAVRCP